MNEAIEKFLNNETYILAYRDNYDSARTVNQELIDYVKQLQQENQQLTTKIAQRDRVIVEAIGWLEQKIASCTMEADYTANDTMCRITIMGLKKLLEILNQDRDEDNNNGR